MQITDFPEFRRAIAYLGRAVGLCSAGRDRAHPIRHIGTPYQVAALAVLLRRPRVRFCADSEHKIDGRLLAKLAEELSKR